MRILIGLLVFTSAYSAFQFASDENYDPLLRQVLAWYALLMPIIFMLVFIIVFFTRLRHEPDSGDMSQ